MTRGFSIASIMEYQAEHQQDIFSTKAQKEQQEIAAVAAVTSNNTSNNNDSVNDNTKMIRFTLKKQPTGAAAGAAARARTSTISTTDTRTVSSSSAAYSSFSADSTTCTPTSAAVTTTVAAQQNGTIVSSASSFRFSFTTSAVTVPQQQPSSAAAAAASPTVIVEGDKNGSSCSCSDNDDDNNDNDMQIMPEDYSKRLVAQLHRRLDTFLSNSKYIERNAKLHTLPRYTREELILGNTIANGGFSSIIDIKCINSQQQPNQKQQQQYVVKSLSTKLALKKLPGATKDIVFEAHTLSSLHHESIIPIHGWCQDGIDTFQTTRRADAFFIILPKLGDTLFQRVYQWQSELKYCSGSTYEGMKQIISKKDIKKIQFHEKIQIMIDVASALSYCHSHRIIHRDIKSANIAFDLSTTKDYDHHGRALLIDFGLATELPAYDRKNPDAVYELTANIGTARYMAPEVITEQKYNEKADVHSFAVLCWECCAGKKPYAHLDANNVKHHVSKRNDRPVPKWSWPFKLQRIMKKGWSRKPKDRPTMAEFHKILIKVQKSLSPCPTVADLLSSHFASNAKTKQ